MLRNLMIVLFAMLFAIAMIGCEGEQGPEGPAGTTGPQGEQGEQGLPGEDGEDAPTPEPYTYIGDNGEECAHCHGGLVDAWAATGHAGAYDVLEGDDLTSPYCVKCHVTGVEHDVIEAVGFADTEFPDGTDDYGFDNYFGVEGEEAEMRRAALEGVQCEACHGALGPVDGVAAHRAEVGMRTTWTEVGTDMYEFESTCNPCHHGQLEEWQQSGHAQSEGGDIVALNDHFGRSSCAPCHTGEGFLAANDPAHAGFDGEYTLIGCTSCHDPHSNGNTAQLRNVDPVYVEYHLGYDPEEDGEMGTMDGYFGGQTCAQCHHARRDTDNVLNQVENGYGHFGPHSSPQMDMFIGYGSYEIEGMDYTRTNAHQTALKSEERGGCVSCHMVRNEEVHGELGEHVFHQFAPQGAACTPCHTFDPGDFDYNDIQTTTMAKMDELSVALGFTDYADFELNYDSEADGQTPDTRAAAYALVFVASDGSHGVHNPSYSGDLLQNAIDHLSLLP